jgi:SAM-dependent methyltransferase
MATAPTAAVSDAARLLPPGRALDLACGSGRHSLWLAEHDWNVVAVDWNAEAIANLRHLRIDARVVDLEQDSSLLQPDAYDLVVCWLYYQRDLYPRIRDAVRPGGIAALCALLQGRFAAARGELQTYFPGWQVLHHLETDRTSELIVRR